MNPQETYLNKENDNNEENSSLQSQIEMMLDELINDNNKISKEDDNEMELHFVDDETSDIEDLQLTDASNFLDKGSILSKQSLNETTQDINQNSLHCVRQKRKCATGQPTAPHPSFFTIGNQNNSQWIGAVNSSFSFHPFEKFVPHFTSQIGMYQIPNGFFQFTKNPFQSIIQNEGSNSININNNYNDENSQRNNPYYMKNIQQSYDNSYNAYSFSGMQKCEWSKRFNSSSFNVNDPKIEQLLSELSIALSKTDKIDYYIYNKLQGNLSDVIKNQKASRIFQGYLKNTHSDILHQIFKELYLNLPELLNNSYANYFCKKLFIFLNQKDRVEYLKAIENEMKFLSLSNIGTYPIQCIIEEVGSKLEKKIIIGAIKDSVEEFCYDIYGAHVLEKILACFEEEFTLFITDYIKLNFSKLSYDSNGICIIKKMLLLTHRKELHETIKKYIRNDCFKLIQDSYGNYVIQVIIENWELFEIREIFSLLKSKLSYLSMQKYSSNVIERFIENDESFLNEYITEIVKEKNKIYDIMKNCFGNYVIQKAIKLAKGNMKKILISSVQGNLLKLNDKKIIAKWRTIIATSTTNINKYICQ